MGDRAAKSQPFVSPVAAILAYTRGSAAPEQYAPCRRATVAAATPSKADALALFLPLRVLPHPPRGRTLLGLERNALLCVAQEVDKVGGARELAAAEAELKADREIVATAVAQHG
eukprot:COSAG06_NODE_25375_length_638_cov_1.252319_1_plen_114_part_01